MSDEIKTDHIFLLGLVCALSKKDSTVILVYNNKEEMVEAIKNLDQVAEQKKIGMLYSEKYRVIQKTDSTILFRLREDMTTVSQIKTDFLILKDRFVK